MPRRDPRDAYGWQYRKDIVVEVHRDVPDVIGLTDEWAELCARQPIYSPTQGPVYCQLAMAHTLPPGARLAVITARRLGVLDGVWPLWVVRERGLSIARHMSWGCNTEYAGPICTCADAIAAMLAVVRREADAIHICGVPASSPPASMDLGLFSHRDAYGSPVIRCAAAGSVETWLSTKSSNFRQKLGNRQRRLATYGQVHSGPVRDDAIDGFVDWLFDTKIAWADAKGLAASWLRKPSVRRFAKAALRRSDSGVIGQAIWLNGSPIAGGISYIGTTFEHAIIANDPAWDKVGVSNLQRASDVSTAIKLGLDFDLRISHDEYKFRWLDDFDPRVTIWVVNRAVALPILLGCHWRRVRLMLGKLKSRFRQWAAR